MPKVRLYNTVLSSLCQSLTALLVAAALTTTCTPAPTTGGRQTIPEQGEQSIYDSLRILGLGLGALEWEVRLV